MSVGDLRVQYKRARIRRTNALQDFVESAMQEGPSVTLTGTKEFNSADQERSGMRTGPQFDSRMMAIAPHFPTLPLYANRIEGANAALDSSNAPADHYRMPTRDIVADIIATDVTSGELKTPLSPADKQKIFALAYTPYVCDTEGGGVDTQGHTDSAGSPDLQRCKPGNAAPKPRVADELLRTSCASMRESGTLLSPAAIAARRSMYVYTGLTLDAQNRCNTDEGIKTDSVQDIDTDATTVKESVAIRVACDGQKSSQSGATLYDLRGTLPAEQSGADDGYASLRIPARRINVHPLSVTTSSRCGNTPDYFETTDEMCDIATKLSYRPGGESSIAVLTSSTRTDATEGACATRAYVSHAVMQHHNVVHYGMEVVYTDRVALTSGVLNSTSAWYNDGVVDSCRINAAGSTPFIDAGPVLTKNDSLYLETSNDSAWSDLWNQDASWVLDAPASNRVTSKGGRRWGRYFEENDQKLYNPVLYVYGIGTSRGRARLRRERFAEVHYRRYRPYIIINSQQSIQWGSLMTSATPTTEVPLTRWLAEVSRSPSKGASPYSIQPLGSASKILDAVNAMPDTYRHLASQWVIPAVEGSLMRPVRIGARTTTYAGNNMQTGAGQTYAAIWQKYSEVIRRSAMLDVNQAPSTCPCLEGSLIVADPVCDCVGALFAAGAVDHETRIPLAMHAWSTNDISGGAVPRGYYRTCQGGSRGRVYGFPNEGVPVMNSTVCNTVNTMIGNDAGRIVLENMGSTVCNGAVAATANATPMWLFAAAIGAMVTIAAVVILRR